MKYQFMLIFNELFLSYQHLIKKNVISFYDIFEKHPWLSGKSTQLIIGEIAGSIPAGCNFFSNIRTKKSIISIIRLLNT